MKEANSSRMNTVATALVYVNNGNAHVSFGMLPLESVSLAFGCFDERSEIFGKSNSMGHCGGRIRSSPRRVSVELPASIWCNSKHSFQNYAFITDCPGDIWLHNWKFWRAQEGVETACGRNDERMLLRLWRFRKVLHFTRATEIGQWSGLRRSCVQRYIEVRLFHFFLKWLVTIFECPLSEWKWSSSSVRSSSAKMTAIWTLPPPPHLFPVNLLRSLLHDLFFMTLLFFPACLSPLPLVDISAPYKPSLSRISCIWCRFLARSTNNRLYLSPSSPCNVLSVEPSFATLFHL